jgi:cardiolipin synthase
VPKRPALSFSFGNAVEVYPSGHRTLEAMGEAIASAEGEVLLETYIFRSDETGRRFAELLAEHAEHGLRIRLL